jgi:hypothetical protein
VPAAEPLFDSEPEIETWTEAALLDALKRRYATQAGNGPRYALATYVRDRAGFDASRTLDAVVMDTWPSSGLALHGFEIKISRSDWRRELADPSKAAAFTRWVDYFWVVAPRNVVRDDELPEGWGLLEPRRGALRAAVKPSLLPAEPLDRSFVACILRAAVTRTTDVRAAS